MSTILFRLRIIAATLAVLLVCQASGQDSKPSYKIYPSGLSIAYGIGHYSVKDEYISGEKYSGTLPYYSLGWVRAHNRYVYHLELIYRYSGKIDNYNVSTEITQFTLNQGFLYPLKKMSLLKKDFFLWLGPNTEFYLFYNLPDIAVAGFDYAQSYAGLLSLGFSADAVYPLNRRFYIESSLRLTLLSLGLRMADSEENDQSPVRFLTSFSGLNTQFNLGMRYYLFDRLSFALNYKFEFVRITGWEALHTASDNVVVGLNYRF